METEITIRDSHLAQLLANVPDELIAQKQWVCWKYQQRGDSRKPTKVPIDPVTGKNADVTNPETHTSFEVAINRYKEDKNISGVGFVFTAQDDFVGIDLDQCVHPETHEPDKWAANIIESAESYCECSPSGEGFHIILRGVAPKGGSRKGKFELYDQDRFFTVTGDVYGNSRVINSRQDAIDELHKEHIAKIATNDGSDNSSLATTSPFDLTRVLSDPENERLKCLLDGDIKEYKSTSEADYAACCMLIRLGATDEDVDKTILGSELCRGKWTQSRGESTYGRLTINKARQEIQEGEVAKQHSIDHMNIEFAVVQIGNRVCILRELPSDKGRPTVHFLDLASFRTATAARPKMGKMPASRAWLADPRRREYKALEFDPSEQCSDQVYNLWRGFEVNPKPGTCSTYLDFVREIICCGDEELFSYVIKWLAHLIQRPAELPEVALVLRAGQGTGKNTFVKPLMDICGTHALETSSVDQLTGRFNGHLSDKILVHANESTWGGNKQAEGTLKTLITEPQRAIERKGQDIVIMHNFARLIVSSNEDWPVAAGLDDRRFVFLDVSDKQKQNAVYFSPIHEELNAGGTEALLDYLFAVDIEAWHPRQRPKRKYGADILMASTCSVTRWLYRCLMEDQLVGSQAHLYQTIPHLFDNEVNNSTLYESYTTYCTKTRERKTESLSVFFKRIHNLCPSISKVRSTCSYSNSRVRQTKFPCIETCTAEFKTVTGIDVEV